MSNRKVRAFATMNEDELIDMRRLIEMLRAEMHNPGAAAHDAPRVDLDQLADNMLYIIDHCLENLEEDEEELERIAARDEGKDFLLSMVMAKYRKSAPPAATHGGYK